MDMGLIIEGGQHIQPSKWVQGLDYPKTITRLVKKPGGKEGKSSDFLAWLGLRWLWPAEILSQAAAFGTQSQTMHNSPSSINYPAISNVLIKSLYQESTVMHPSHLIGSEICDENRL